MEIRIIEDKKSKLVFELDGVTHGFCNLLREELWNNNHVKVSTYAVKHPLIGKPRFIVETDGADPRKLLVDTTEKLKKLNSSFEKDFVKEVR